MGFLEKAKEQLAKSFGEETVKMVTYPPPEEEQEEVLIRPSKPPREQSPRPMKKPEKPSRPVKKNAPSKEEKQPKREGKAKRPTKPRKEVHGTKEPASPQSPSKAEKPQKQGPFFVEEEIDFLSTPPAPPQEELDNDVPAIEVKEGRIQDVLSLLNVAPTFKLEKDILLPEDLAGQQVGFDLQTPYGYDQGQVDLFVAQVRGTVQRYFDLLTLRNEDVAKLASAVDKLQVDSANHLYQAEAAQGISLMPAADSEELEEKLIEARLTIRRLEADLHRATPQGSSLAKEERRKYEGLQDENSDLRRKVEELQEEAEVLRTTVKRLELELPETDVPSPLQEGAGIPLPPLSSPQVGASSSLPLPLPSTPSQDMTSPYDELLSTWEGEEE